MNNNLVSALIIYGIDRALQHFCAPLRDRELSYLILSDAYILAKPANNFKPVHKVVVSQVEIRYGI